MLSHQYEICKNVQREMEFTVEGVFDAKIDAAPIIRRRAEEEDQIDELVAKKKAFSASCIYTSIRTMYVISEAILKAQRRQMELYARELEDKDHKRRLAERKRLEYTNRAKTKHSNYEKLKLTELKGALNYCLKAAESE